MFRVPIPVDKCSFSESLDWREGGDEVKQYMEERVHLNWALGEGDSRWVWSRDSPTLETRINGRV